MAYDRNVFILGAGASKDAGAPILGDFMLKAHEVYDIWRFDGPSWRNRRPSEDDREAFAEVFKWQRTMASVLTYLDIDLGNIEDLFSLVDMAGQLDIEEVSNIGAHLKRLVCRTLEESIELRKMSKVLDKEEPVGSYPYVLLAKWLRGRMHLHDDDPNLAVRDSIISLNYDIACEQAIESVMGQHMFTYGEPWIKEKVTNARLKVMKLHGSINWGLCSKQKCGYQHVDKTINACTTIMNFETADQYSVMRPTSKFYKECPECHAGVVEPFIVPPTWNKAGYGNKVTPVWTAAYHEIKDAARVIIIGYSLPETDSFFKYLLALGLSENDSLQQIIVVNPDEGAQERYQNFIASHFKRRSFEPCIKKFEGWIDELDRG